MASPEQANSSSSSINVSPNHRVILRLCGFQESKQPLGDRAGLLQRVIRNGQARLVGDVVIASDAQHIYIDTVRSAAEDPTAMLALLIEQTDDTIVASGIPAEIDAARMSGKLHPELVTQYAWLEMGRDDSTDVTLDAINLAAEHRQRDIDRALESFLPHAS